MLNKDLVQKGDVPVFSANVNEPFGYTDKLLISDFSLDSVLWGIDGDWMVSFIPKDRQFYPTDHCGVLRCKTNEVNPKYLAHVLEKEGRNLGFSRAYRASIDRIQSINFFVPNITKQNEIVAKVTDIEKEIEEASEHLEDLCGKVTEILNKFLR